MLFIAYNSCFRTRPSASSLGGGIRGFRTDEILHSEQVCVKPQSVTGRLDGKFGVSLL